MSIFFFKVFFIIIYFLPKDFYFSKRLFFSLVFNYFFNYWAPFFFKNLLLFFFLKKNLKSIQQRVRGLKSNLRTKDKPQQIVTRRPLYCLQYLVHYPSYTDDFFNKKRHDIYDVAYKANWYQSSLQETYLLGFFLKNFSCQSICKTNRVIEFYSMGSGLEAFSHSPTDGSFAPLAGQLSALPIIWINGSSRTKLNYYHDDHWKKKNCCQF